MKQPLGKGRKQLHSGYRGPIFLVDWNPFTKQLEARMGDALESDETTVVVVVLLENP